MKRWLLVVLSVIATVSVASAVEVPGNVSMNAVIDLTGTGMTTWYAVIKNVSDNQPAAILGWSDVVPQVTPYKVSNQYIEINATITDPIDWRMLIHTNNTQYTGSTDAGGYGLVAIDDTSAGLPLAWKVVDSTAPVIETPVFSTNRPDGSEGFTDYQWKFLVDQTQTGTYGWDPLDTYVRVWSNVPEADAGGSTGIYWNEGVGVDMDPDTAGDQPSPAPSVDNSVRVYVASDFTTAMAQRYATTTLTLEVLIP
ncbi:MAG: hypothetical protein ABII23_07645 [bacterium]